MLKIARNIVFSCGLAVALTAPALAQQNPGMEQGKMGGMEHGKMGQGQMGGMEHGDMGAMQGGQMGGMDCCKNTPANPYAESQMRMHKSMMGAVGADASETWVRKMIEHHRGAVEMSKIAVAQAKDKETRDKAQKTMGMQNKEIAELQAWLKRHGKTAQ